MTIAQKQAFLDRLAASTTAAEAALVYRDMIQVTMAVPEHVTDPAIGHLNAYILSRWSLNTLVSIKREAWRLVGAAEAWA